LSFANKSKIEKVMMMQYINCVVKDTKCGLLR